MEVSKKTKELLKLFKKKKYKTVTALNYETDIQLLVSVILSAQCTDERVNLVTQELFKKYKTPEDFANADIEVFKLEIKSTGFFNNKAKNIIASSKKIVNDFNSLVPDNMENLLSLPGVARKTANVVLGALFKKNEGVVVDTHVKRLSFRIGLTKNTNPDKIEKDLMNIIDKKEWYNFSHYLIYHGRSVCSARKPLCQECFIESLCNKTGV